MHFGHHHCPSPSNNISPAVVACIAGASSASRNTENEDTSSCSLWCSFCGFLRYLLVFLALLACAIDFMLRFNISVAIVSMVNNSVTNDVNFSYACPAAHNASSAAQSTTGAGEYNWSPQEQGLVLGTFFWGFLITKTIGGRIAELLGPTFTVTLTVGLGGVLTLLTPNAADVHPLLLAALRLLLGILQGPIYPAIYSIISRWTLPGETTTMVSLAEAGIGLGSLVALGVPGIVIKSFGWRWVFWGSGILALVWLPFWIIYVRDDPRQHPGISSRELRRLSDNHNKPRRKVPWSRIFRSRHIYLFIMMEFVNMWIQGLLLTEGPTFLTSQVGIDIETAGMLNMVTMAVFQLSCISYGWLSGLIERRDWLPMITFLRLTQGFAMVITLGCMVGLMMAGCNATLVAVFFPVLGFAAPMQALIYLMGPMIVAPNYAGTLSGITGVGSLGGFVLPMVLSYFIDKKNGWVIICVISGIILIVADVIYIIWMPTEEAEWNMYEEIPGSDEANKEKEEGKTGRSVTE